MSPKAQPQTRTGPNPVPFIILFVVLLLAAVATIVLSSSDGSSDDGLLQQASVSVDGGALPRFEQSEGDLAIGIPIPKLTGKDFQGDRAVVEGGDGPMLLAFLAHWCPHCQAEVPRLVRVMQAGGFDGLDVVAVVTGTDSTQGNYPPSAWLNREGWPGRVLLDDSDNLAAAAYGLSSYPFLVLVDSDGKVVARASGEQGEDALVAFAALALEGGELPDLDTGPATDVDTGEDLETDDADDSSADDPDDGDSADPQDQTDDADADDTEDGGTDSAG